MPSGTWKRESLVELGNVLARRLELDPRLAELSPAIRTAVQELGVTSAGRQTAREEVRFFREARSRAETTLDHTIRNAYADVMRAVEHDAKAPLPMQLFPEGWAVLLHDRIAARGARLHTLAEALAGAPGQEAGATALQEAVQAWDAAQASFQLARRKAVVANRAADAARKAFVDRYRLAHAAVITRIGDLKAADDVFPPLGRRARATESSAATTAAATASPATPPAPSHPQAA
jgi:hypothetical protein